MTKRLLKKSINFSGNTMMFSAPRQSRDILVSFLTYISVASLGAYVVLYDSLPSSRGLLSMAAVTAIFATLYLTMIKSFARLLPLTLTLFSFIIITILLDKSGLPQNYEVLYRYVPSLAGIFVFHYVRIYDATRIISFVGMIVISYGLFIAATNGVIEHAGSSRLMEFWPGYLNSAGVVSALVIAIAFSRFKPVTKFIWCTLGMVLVIGYGVVTVALSMVIFFGGYLLHSLGCKRIWFYIFGSFAVVGGIFFRDSNSLEGADIKTLGAGAIGSGRFDSWAERWEIFSDRTVLDKIFGKGPYSDYIISDLWYWEPKNAHSDILTILMEFGIIGLVFTIFLWFSVYLKSNRIGQLVLLSIAFGASASNTFLDRPMVALAWGFALHAANTYRNQLSERD